MLKFISIKTIILALISYRLLDLFNPLLLLIFIYVFASLHDILKNLIKLMIIFYIFLIFIYE